jgi:hypothetical protein
MARPRNHINNSYFNNKNKKILSTKALKYKYYNWTPLQVTEKLETVFMPKTMPMSVNCASDSNEVGLNQKVWVSGSWMNMP